MGGLRRIAVTAVGLLVLGLGVALIVLPGPGVLVIVAGLAILATEYAWARRLLDSTRTRAVAGQRAAVESGWRVAGTMVFALGLVALGVVSIVVPQIPYAGPVSGWLMIVGGAVIVATTVLTLRAVRRENAGR